MGQGQDWDKVYLTMSSLPPATGPQEEISRTHEMSVSAFTCRLLSPGTQVTGHIKVVILG